MAGKSAKNNNRGSNLLGFFVSGKDEQYHTNQFAASDLSGLTASGGTTTEPGNGYKYHFFTSSGTFSVTEIGDLAAFLSSEKSSFITGTSIIADGGQGKSIWNENFYWQR